LRNVPDVQFTPLSNTVADFVMMMPDKAPFSPGRPDVDETQLTDGYPRMSMEEMMLAESFLRTLL